MYSVYQLGRLIVRPTVGPFHDLKYPMLIGGADEYMPLASQKDRCCCLKRHGLEARNCNGLLYAFIG